MGPRRISFLLLGLLLALALPGCDPHRSPDGDGTSEPNAAERPPIEGSDRSADESGTPDRPNVLLVVVDTLRSDRVGCYGSRRDTTPNMDALAADGVRFARAYATAPWTMPSVGSMITGLYPSSCMTTGTFGKFPDRLVTLAEILKQEGYATTGIVSHFLLGERFNFHQGLDTCLESEAGDYNHVSTPGVTRQAVEALRRFSKIERPFFMMVHYFDPHYNYVNHPEYEFAASSAGRLDGTQSITALRAMLDDMTVEEIGFLKDLYDEEIRSTDAGIGRLLGTLRELALYDQTIVILVADHGEEFLAHGWLGHTKTLYEELVHVPLIIRVPGEKAGGRVVRSRVSLVSLTPTILDLAGIEPASRHFQGASLAPLMERDVVDLSTTIFCEVDFDSRRPIDAGKKTHKKAVIWDRYKLIRDDTSSKIELYDLQDDPDERNDLIRKHPKLAGKLLGILQQRINLAASQDTHPDQVGLTAEELERLHTLGYVGG